MPDVAAPRVSVIVPTYRDWDRLALLIASLAAQDWPVDKLEIIVVNNDPDEAPPETLQVPANARILTEAGKGSYAARNAGLAQARGEIAAYDFDRVLGRRLLGAVRRNLQLKWSDLA